MGGLGGRSLKRVGGGGEGGVVGGVWDRWCLSCFVPWEGSWRGVGDASSLTGSNLLLPRHPQPGRGDVPGPPTYIHDVLPV